MAKKAAVNLDLFAKTAPAQEAAPADDIIQARGVGLKRSEWAQIDEQARKLKMTPHRVAAYLLRYGLAALQAGKIKTKTEKKTVFDTE